MLRVDIKDGRIRVICSADEWIAEWSTIGNHYKKENHAIINCFPFTKKGIYASKGKVGDAFVNLIERMNLSIDSLEKSLQEGNIAGENDDW